MSIPATGKTVRLTATFVSRLSDGEIGGCTAS